LRRWKKAIDAVNTLHKHHRLFLVRFNKSGASGFFKAGANVLLTSRDEKACRDAAERLIEEGDGTGTRSAGPHNNNNNKCHYVASNVSSREGCELLAARAAKVFDNRLDVRICICIG